MGILQVHHGHVVAYHQLGYCSEMGIDKFENEIIPELKATVLAVILWKFQWAQITSNTQSTFNTQSYLE